MTTITFTKEQYIQISSKIKQLAANKEISATDIILYNLFRGLSRERGFTPITNSGKLSGGGGAMRGFMAAQGSLSYRIRYYPKAIRERFGDFLTDEILKQHFLPQL